MSAKRGSLKTAWADVRRSAIRLLPPEKRDYFEEVVLDLLSVTDAGSPWDPDEGERHRILLEIGVSTMSRVASHAPQDPELMAAITVLPWFDPELLGSRSALATRPGQLTWPAAMVLAMSPAGLRTLDPAHRDDRTVVLRQLWALPPLLRSAVILERHLARESATAARLPLFPVRPFDEQQLSLLAPGIPADLLPPTSRQADSLAPTLPPPVGSPAEAISLLKKTPAWRFGSYEMSVEGNSDYLVTAEELIYRVRWDVPAGAIRRQEPPMLYPGDQFAIAYREPGWIIDRLTREVRTVDLSTIEGRGNTASQRVFPLPPGWRLGGRSPIADGVAGDLIQLMPTAARSALEALLREMTAHYIAALADKTWPDYLVAWRIARHAVWTLDGAGVTDPTIHGAALLTARGMAPADTLVDPASEAWKTAAGSLAREAHAAEDENYEPGLSRRIARLTNSSPAVRAVVLADARARASVETDLFGVTPRARRDEMAAISTLTGDQPDLQRILEHGQVASIGGHG